jgi:hypothetical protein
MSHWPGWANRWRSRIAFSRDLDLPRRAPPPHTVQRSGRSLVAAVLERGNHSPTKRHSRLTRLPCCRLRVCTLCLNRNVRGKVDEYRSRGLHELRCPTCPNRNLSVPFLEAHLDVEVLAAVSEAHDVWALTAMDDVVRCPVLDCGQPIVSDLVRLVADASQPRPRLLHAHLAGGGLLWPSFRRPLPCSSPSHFLLLLPEYTLRLCGLSH